MKVYLKLRANRIGQTIPITGNLLHHSFRSNIHSYFQSKYLLFEEHEKNMVARSQEDPREDSQVAGTRHHVAVAYFMCKKACSFD